jgi:hypothetical protein
VSLDYYVWWGPRLTADEFTARLEQAQRTADPTLFERSDRLGQFRREVLRLYPPLEQTTPQSSSPWAMTPPDSDRYIEINLTWAASQEQVADIVVRALTRGLYLDDPQSHAVHTPGPARWQIWLRRIGVNSLAGPDR